MVVIIINIIFLSLLFLVLLVSWLLLLYIYMWAFCWSTEGKHQDPTEFWSTPKDDEEAVASQQETQTIFFIQQVGTMV